LKNYRILRIAGLHYFSAFERWLQDNPEFENSSYDEMLKRFFNSSIMYSDGFSCSFIKLGQDAHEIIADFEIVQKQWALENGINYDPNSWMIDILMAQIEKIKPDIIYFQGTEWNIPGRFFPLRNNDNLIKILKEEYPFIKKVISFSGYPSHIERLSHADFLFFSSPGNVQQYKNQGLDALMQSAQLYHSFDVTCLKRLEETGKQYDFSFLGSSRVPESRYYALRQLFEQTDLKAWINEQEIVRGNNSVKQNVRDLLKRTFQLFSYDQVNDLANSIYLPAKLRNIFHEIAMENYAFKGINRKNGFLISLKELYPDSCHPPIMGVDMYKILSQSKIVFNKHADAAFGNVGNMRMFEATGVGTCLLTDTGSNMPDLFEDGKEVVTYKTIDEAVEKVNYLLDHPNETEQIAKAGQARTLKDHTIGNRCQRIDEVIQKLL